MKQYKVIRIERLAANTICLRTERPNVPIRAGQCFNVGIPGGGINREYSMYSGADDPYLDFLIRVVEDGLVSSKLGKLKPGDTVEIDGPYGEFSLKDPSNSRNRYLFISSGTGIAPFHSFINTFPNLTYKVLHGIRLENEQYHVNDYAQGSYIPCISQPEGNKPGNRVTDYLREHPAEQGSIVYLCGNRNMIVDTFEILRDQDINGDNIFTEVFF
jgi:ferredoxin--NADP+ reductase